MVEEGSVSFIETDFYVIDVDGSLEDAPDWFIKAYCTEPCEFFDEISTADQFDY